MKKDTGCGTNQPTQCDICCSEESPKNIIRPCKCHTRYCVSCLKQRFTLASKDASLMPPACCGGLLPIHLALPHLSAEEAQKYRARFDEWRSPRKIYCPVPWCSTFIPDRLLPQDMRTAQDSATPSKTPRSSLRQNRSDPLSASQHSSNQSLAQPSAVDCPICQARICVSCKQLSHPGRPCKDFVEQKTRQVLNRLGYKSCPSCGHGVRRMYGCNHMQCVCGVHFCWGCRKPIGECEETEECLSDDERDCMELEQDLDLERLNLLVILLERAVYEDEQKPDFRTMCKFVLEQYLESSDTYHGPPPEVHERRVDLLQILEAISADYPNQRYGGYFDDGKEFVQSLGGLARRQPDGTKPGDQEAIQIMVEFLRSEISSRSQAGVVEENLIIDLDRRDAEERSLELGFEPVEPVRHQGQCQHEFKEYRVQRLLNANPGVSLALNKMECHRCWQPIRVKTDTSLPQAKTTRTARYALRSLASRAVEPPAPPAPTPFEISALSCSRCKIMFCGACADTIGATVTDG